MPARSPSPAAARSPIAACTAVFLVGEIGTSGRRVGELDEEMVYESRVGEIIALGATQLADRGHPAGSGRGFARAGCSGQDPVLARRRSRPPDRAGPGPGRVRAPAGKRTGRGDRGRARPEAASRDHDLDELAADNVLGYLQDERDAAGDAAHGPARGGGAVPRRAGRLARRRPDSRSVGASTHPGLWRWSRGWRRSSAAGLRPSGPTTASRSGCPKARPPATSTPSRRSSFLRPTRSRTWSSAGSEHRPCSRPGSAKTLPGRCCCPPPAGLGTPLWQQRQRSADLLAVASRYGSFPIMVETYRECLDDLFDLPALRDVSAEWRRARSSVGDVETVAASPFAGSLLFDYLAAYMYEGDAPLAERRAAPLPSTATCCGAARAGGVARPHRPGGPGRPGTDPAGAPARAGGEVHRQSPRPAAPPGRSFARGGGGANRSRPRPRHGWRPWRDRDGPWRCGLPARPAGSRSKTRLATATAWEWRCRWAYPRPSWRRRKRRCPGWLPAGPEATARSTRRRWRRVGRCRWRRDGAGGLLEAGTILRGEFRPDGTQREWCDPEVLRQLRRRSLARLRREVEPVRAGRVGSVPAGLAGSPSDRRAGLSGASWRGRSGAAGRGSRTAFRRPDTRLRPGARRVAGPDPRLPPRLLDELGALGEVAWGRRRQPGPRRRSHRPVPARPRGAAAARREIPPRRRRTGAAARSIGWGSGARPSTASSVRGRTRAGARRPRRSVGTGLGRPSHHDTFSPLRALRWRRPSGEHRPRPGRLQMGRPRPPAVVLVEGRGRRRGRLRGPDPAGAARLRAWHGRHSPRPRPRLSSTRAAAQLGLGRGHGPAPLAGDRVA